MTTVREVPVTATATEPGAALLRAYVDACNDVSRSVWGTDDYRREPAEMLEAMREKPYETFVRLVALDDEHADVPDDEIPLEAVLGTGVVVLPQQDNLTWAYVGATVRPAHRGRGVGSTILDACLALARENGRTTLMAETDHRAEPPEGPESLTAPTGSGRVPLDEAGVRFLTQRGWDLEQVARRSVLPLPLDPAVVEEQRARAALAAGDDYRTVSWDGPVPDEWVEAMAALYTEMSDAPPMGGLEYEQDQWDAARVRHHDDEHAKRGIQSWTTVAQHVPSGALVGYTTLMEVPPVRDLVHQEDTLVAAAHRGHRLGMLLKATNLQRLAAARPDARRIDTWNAEENGHMLAINVDLGFRPAGCSGEWQLKLGTAHGQTTP